MAACGEAVMMKQKPLRSIRRLLFYYGLLRNRKLRQAMRSIEVRITSRTSTIRTTSLRPRLQYTLKKVRIDRHSTPPAASLVCGCFNVRSLANKVDDLLDVRHEQNIDVLFLVETWHDSDSVSLRRLRTGGFQVVDRPRPRSTTDTLATNHGGVAAVAVAGVKLAVCDLGCQPLTFELLGVRVGAGTSSFIAAAVYRPVSAALSPAFFEELIEVLGRLATYR
jgi:hypothetical protein